MKTSEERGGGGAGEQGRKTTPTPPYSHTFKTLLAALALLAITFLSAAPFFQVPMQRDQGVYAACGSILLHGGAPYNDCWDTKGPLTHYTYALAQLLFGINLSGPVILSTIMTGLTGLVVWRIARHWFDTGLAWMTGLLYALLVVSIPFDMNAQSEGFANLFIALGVWAILNTQANDRTNVIPRRDPLGRAEESLPSSAQRQRFLTAARTNAKQYGLLWLAGIAFAFAFAYKYTIILPIGVVAFVALFTAKPTVATSFAVHPTPHASRHTPHALRLTLHVALSFLATLLIFTLYLLLRGALGLAFEHLIFMLTEFPKVAVNPTLLLFPGESGPPLFYWQRTVLQFMRLPVIHIFGLLGCAIAFLKKRSWAWLITLWLIAALASVYPQKVMTLYHWTLSLVPLTLGVGTLIWEIKESFTNYHSSFVRRLPTVVCLLFIFANLALRFYEDQWLISAKYLAGQQTLKEFYDSQAIGDEIEVAEYIRDRTTPDDLIWVWGNHSIMYYWADRRSPTRFIFNSPIMAAIGPNDFQPRWKTEVLDALQQRPPTYIVITYFDRTWFDYENPVDEFKKIPGYQDFLDRYYRQESFIGRFAIYRLTPWWSRYNFPTLLEAVTAYDLLGNLDSATLTSAPNEPIQATEFQLYDESPYPTLLMHPEANAVFNLTLPSGVICFRSDLALDPLSWGWGGDGANFVLTIDAEKIFEQYIGNTITDRFWQPVIVDLSRWAGQTVMLTLSTGPGPHSDFTGDRAGWGLPRVLKSPGNSCVARVIGK